MFWKELFDFFADHDVEYIDIVPCYEKNGRYTLTEEHYIDFYTHAFGLWWIMENDLSLGRSKTL